MNPAAFIGLVAAMAVLPPPEGPTPAAGPTPVASEAPLREIGRVRAVTAFCKSILVPAASAVGFTLDNDGRLSFVVSSLRHYDFDTNVLIKNKSVKDLTRQFVELRKAAVDGQREVGRLREAAKAASDKDQAADLKAFADALGGALARQKRLADNLGSFIAYLDGKNPDRDAFLEMLPVFKEHQGLTGDARDAADQFVQRVEPVGHDEENAAAHLAAFRACRGE